MPPKTLVVIDMHPEYVDGCDGHMSAAADAVLSLVRRAKARSWAIILVESGHMGRTRRDILDEIGRYPRAGTVVKDRCDGGGEVLRLLDHHPAWPTDLVVCGIYGDQCVAYTVAGLLDDAGGSVDVSVAADAVCPTYLSRTRGASRRERVVGADDLVGG